MKFCGFLFANFDVDYTQQPSSVWSREYIPKGTRFGPLQGDIVPPEAKSDGHFWKVSFRHAYPINVIIYLCFTSNKIFFNKTQVFTTDNRVYHYIDVASKNSNWMRFVQIACSEEEQNVVACQVDFQIFFYTTKPIPANCELLMAATRHCMPSSGKFHCTATDYYLYFILLVYRLVVQRFHLLLLYLNPLLRESNP